MSLVGMPGYQETPAGWIPHDWMATTLGAVADFKGGNAFKEKFQGKKAGDFPFIKVSDFSLPLNQKFIRDANNWIDADTNKEIKATLFEQGAVVFAKVGAALLLNRRRVLTRKTAIDNNLMAATPRTIDPTFLYFHLQTVDFGKLVQDGAVPSVNQGQLQALPLAQPPLEEQQKIAAILTAVDDKLDVIARQIESIQSLKQGLMQTLFSRGVGTQDADGRWVPHAEFKDSELGEIPVGWECLRLGDVLAEKPEYGANASAVPFDAENQIRYLRITDIDEHGQLRSDSIKAIPSDEAKGYILADGDLLIARSGNTVGKSILYKSAMGVCAFAGYLLRFRFGCKMLVEFVAAYLTSDTYRAWVKASVKVGAQPNINAQQYQAMFIPVPPIEEQQRIAAVLAGVDAKVELLRARQTQFQSLKRGLMQKLLTGEWRVSVDASVTGA